MTIEKMKMIFGKFEKKMCDKDLQDLYIKHRTD